MNPRLCDRRAFTFGPFCYTSATSIALITIQNYYPKKYDVRCAYLITFFIVTTSCLTG